MGVRGAEALEIGSRAAGIAAGVVEFQAAPQAFFVGSADLRPPNRIYYYYYYDYYYYYYDFYDDDYY